MGRAGVANAHSSCHRGVALWFRAHVGPIPRCCPFVSRMLGMATTKLLASVGKAVRIVDFLARSDADGVPLTLIARSLDINKTTAYNTLATLREYTWVEQDEETGYYRLGEGIGPIASYHTHTQRIVDELHPVLVGISRRFNELVHLGRLTGTSIIYLDKVEPDRAIRVVSRIGREAVAARTSLGRALIASSPEGERSVDYFLSDPSLKLAREETIDSLRASLESNIELFPTRGWTQKLEENEAGICCVAVPISLPGGGTMAISVSTPTERMPEERRVEFARGIAEEVRMHADSIGVSLFHDIR